MTEARGRCGGCDHFRTNVDPNVKCDGYCQANPPQMVVFPAPNGRPVLKSMFPPVSLGEWCGAWKVDRKESVS